MEKIIKIKKLENISSSRFDIEVDNVHNFFANDILVHNCKIGSDSKGKFFIESSSSGPQFEHGAFGNFTKNKFGESNPISDSYDDVFKELKNHKPLQQYIKQFPEGVKLFCELLYTPLAKQIEDKLQFLVIKYDKGTLGKKFSLIFFKAEDLEGKQLKNESQIFSDLKKLSTADIVMDDQTVNYSDIDINYEVDSFYEMIKDFTDIKSILTSRKAIDKNTKNALIEIIQKAQQTISDKIIKTNFNHKFKGDQMEGIVIYFQSGQVVKIVSPEYKTGKIEFNKSYEEKKK